MPEETKVAATLAGLVLIFLLGEIGSAARRRWREWNGDDTTYNADDWAARLALGRRLLIGLSVAIATVTLLIATLKAQNPSDPLAALRPRGWDCIFKTGDIVGCSREGARAN